MSRYAENTSVSAEKSRAEIEASLRRYGADQFAYMTSRTEARVGFVAQGRQVQFRLEMPDPNDRQFTHTPKRKNARSPQQAEAAWDPNDRQFTHTPERKNARSPQQAEAAWEQATRQRWRALALVIKAKLEAVEAGITEFDDEFLAHIMLPNGQTIGQSLKPQLDEVYSSGRMLELMP